MLVRGDLAGRRNKWRIPQEQSVPMKLIDELLGVSKARSAVV